MDRMICFVEAYSGTFNDYKETFPSKAMVFWLSFDYHVLWHNLYCMLSTIELELWILMLLQLPAVGIHRLLITFHACSSPVRGLHNLLLKILWYDHWYFQKVICAHETFQIFQGLQTHDITDDCWAKVIKIHNAHHLYIIVFLSISTLPITRSRTGKLGCFILSVSYI